MDRNRKILIAILALLVLSAVIAIIDISLNMQDTTIPVLGLGGPRVGPGVAIVRVSGTIEMLSDSGPFGVSHGAETVIRKLDEIENNPSIKAVVLRINSPGGTVAATQEIYQKLWRLRKKNIMLVASMGEVAASGGYYIASACNYIMANYGTITGSIGVIVRSPNLKKLMDKLGIEMNSIKTGRYKDIMSSFFDMTPEERTIIQELVNSSYRKFLSDVAKGRSMSVTDIEPYADGRIMGGETALKYKLVDGLGTFEEAIEKAKALAKLPEDAPVFEETRNTLRQLMFGIDGLFKGRAMVPEMLDTERIPKFEYRWQP
jgi:protease-4